MLLDTLIYFSNYNSIVQIDGYVNELSIEVNYSDNMLLYFLDNDSHLDICKSWIKYLDDKSLLTPYLVKYSRDSEWVKLLLTFYPEVDYKYRIHELLVSCVRYSHLEVVKWLVNNGADIRVDKYEPFRFACEFGHLEIAKYLLDLIDDLEEKRLCVQSNYNNALIMSAYRGHLVVVKWLVNNGASFKGIISGLHFACENGHLEIAVYLLNLIDDPEEKKLCVQSGDDCALTSSVTNGHLEVVKWLVKNEANIRVNNYEPFRYACEYGHLETAKYLLSLIDTDEDRKLCVQSDDNYALILSAKNGHLEVVKWLVNNGANIRTNDYEAFRYACEYGHLEIVQYLFDLIGDVEEKKLCIQSDDNYALRLSTSNNHLDVVKWLTDQRIV